MLSLTTNIAALMMYLCASAYVLMLLIRNQSLQQQWLFAMASCAIIFHGLGLYYLMFMAEGIDLSIYKMASLIMFCVTAIVLISSSRKPLHNLFILLFPFSIVAIAFSMMHLNQSPNISHLSTGVVAHILMSIIAYSLLTIATLQALLLHWQNTRLKSRQLTGLIKHLPPLQTMESLMFEVLWVGVILLLGGIVVGALFLEDIFAQHLVHKTVLSIIALLIYATLLWGRIAKGWRSRTAVAWVLGGFCILMLAYFGSKVVLELILK